MWGEQGEIETDRNVRRGLTTLCEFPMWLNTISLAKVLKLESAVCADDEACMTISTTIRLGTEKFSERMFATTKADGHGDSLDCRHALRRAVLAINYFDLEPSTTQNDGSVISIILHGKNRKGGDLSE